ncbi:MAG TPA: bifunctional methylenetetrahydrofolate dehydrogenase/methenyltetrahydrofolate cyclohydrolase, partial [Euryarchaeota archaeon]|nr:bifunctional methylenetetrahydrofolate dehydrogenase/methenyltetrahydrofolate cyclohydrolase [Euryarchaeota archaeon]
MILDGKAVAKKIETKIKEKAKEFSDEFGMKASLHTVLVGNDEASRIYAKSKLKTLKNLGMEGEIHFMDEDSREE